jgi:parallel beta-helix repeat protein
MHGLRPHGLYLAAAAVFAPVAFLEQPIAVRRPAPLELRTTTRIPVTSGKDTGPGSLRWAIFTADQAQVRVSLVIHTRRIVLETPLPPLLNPAGVVIEAPGEGVEIDGHNLRQGALLDIGSQGSVVSGVRFRKAAGQGILVRSSGVVLRGLSFTDCEEGIHVLAGAEAVTVEGSTFDQNGIGVALDPDVLGIDIHENRFRKHDKAAIWAVSPSERLRTSAPVLILRNNFEEDRMSLVLIHVPARVEDNQFLRPAEAAAYVTGAPVLLRNRVEAGASVGIYADDVDGALLDENEVSNCLAVGILLRRSRNTEIRRSRVYGNGYGIAVVFDGAGAASVIADNMVVRQRVDGLLMVGASPIVQDNRILGNNQAGLRILDYIPIRGARLAGLPVVRGNVLKDNRWDQLRGDYREAPEGRPRQ